MNHVHVYRVIISHLKSQFYEIFTTKVISIFVYYKEVYKIAIKRWRIAVYGLEAPTDWKQTRHHGTCAAAPGEPPATDRKRVPSLLLLL